MSPWPSPRVRHGLGDVVYPEDCVAHSVTAEDDYICLWLAQFRALQLRFEVATDDLVGINGFRSDCWIVDGFSHKQTPRLELGTIHCWQGCVGNQMACAAVDELPWQRHHLGSGAICGMDSRTDVEPCLDGGASEVEFIACGACASDFDKNENSSHMAGCNIAEECVQFVHSNASNLARGSDMQSCLKNRRETHTSDGPREGDKSGCRARILRFDFAVSFWFPAAGQVQGAFASCETEVPSSLNAFTVPTSHTSACAVRPEGCIPGVVAEQHAAKPNILLPAVYGRKARPGQVRFNSGSPPYAPRGHQQPRFLHERPASSEAIHSFPSPALLAAISAPSEVYTCFVWIRQVDVRPKQHYWDVRNCATDAISSSTLPNPQRLALTFTLSHFPVPQILVSQYGRRFSHRAVVVQYVEAPLEPWVCDIPTGQMLDDFLHEVSMRPPKAWLALFTNQVQYDCFVNGEQLPCASLVPAAAEAIRLTTPHKLSQEAPNPQDDVGRRSPTPPAISASEDEFSSSPTASPQEGFLPEAAFPCLAPPELTCAGPGRWRLPWAVRPGSECRLPDGQHHTPWQHQIDSLASSDSQQFAVFDLHRNARVLPTPSVVTERALVQAAFEATPELSRPVEYRLLRHTIPFWPCPQLVIHARLPHDEVVFPIAFVNPYEVCTVQLRKSAHPFAAPAAANRKCDTPRRVYQAVARGDAQLRVNGVPRQAFMVGAFRAVDSARYMEVPFSSGFLHSNVPRRWPTGRVLTLHETRPWEITDEAQGSEFMVHFLQPVLVQVPSHFRPHLASRCVRMQLGCTPDHHIFLPDASPAVAGTPPHVAMFALGSEEPGEAWCIVDLRRMRAGADFRLLRLPRFMDPTSLPGLLRQHAPDMAPIGRIYLEWDLLNRPCEARARVPLLTLVPGDVLSLRQLQQRPPAILHTFALLSARSGFAPPSSPLIEHLECDMRTLHRKKRRTMNLTTRPRSGRLPPRPVLRTPLQQFWRLVLALQAPPRWRRLLRRWLYVSLHHMSWQIHCLLCGRGPFIFFWRLPIQASCLPASGGVIGHQTSLLT